MALINARELGRRVRLEGLQPTIRHLNGALMEGHLTPQDFSIRDLCEALMVTRQGEACGREYIQACGPRKSGGLILMEAEDGVDPTAFLNISGQLAYSSVMQGYRQAVFIGDQFVETIHTDLSGERIPGLANIADPSDDEVGTGMPYPHIGFGEDYVDTPATTKRGFIISLFRETIFYDRTNEVVTRARQVGEILRRRKEKRLMRMILGLTNNFKWKGTTYNTYQSAAPWINLKASNAIDPGNGWVQVDAAEQVFTDMLDPNTSEPITVEPNAILHMPGRMMAFNGIFGANEVRTVTGAVTTIRPNMTNSYTRYVSRYAYRELIAAGESAANAKDYWVMGDFRRAFVYMENWPVTVTQPASNSEAEFNQDIVARFKASEKGVAAVRDPRAVVINFATSTLLS